MTAEHAFPPGEYAEPYRAVPDADDASDRVYSLTGYDRLVIFRNPHSTRAGGGGLLDALESTGQGYGLDVVTCDTSPHLGGSVADLERHIAADSLIVAETGDGGLGMLLNSVRAAGLQNAVLAVPKGGKNDIATSLGAQQLLKDPVEALVRARPRLVRPIEVSFGYEDEALTTIDAYGYASVGISSQVAARINQSSYRNSPLLKVPGGRYLLERFTTARTFADTDPLFVEYPDGVTRPTLDVIAANTSRMAGSLRPRADILENNFRLITAKRRLGALAVLSGMMLGAPVGETVEPDERRRFTFTIPQGTEAYLQIDGEQHRLTGDRQRLAVRVIVELAMASTGVNMLSLAA
jgi:diacylglycerol kinase family enzyme